MSIKRSGEKDVDGRQEDGDGGEDEGRDDGSGSGNEFVEKSNRLRTETIT
jgi:hypothetical protein